MTAQHDLQRLAESVAAMVATHADFPDLPLPGTAGAAVTATAGIDATGAPCVHVTAWVAGEVAGSAVAARRPAITA